jgi:rhamnosyltransferase
MFDEMSTRDLDFWGITRHYGMNFDPWGKCKYGYIPMHIQSAFMVVRSSMVKSEEFQQYWENMPMIHDYAEAICWHEVIFTEDFSRKGFSSGTYVDTDDLKEYIDYPLMLYPTELIANRKCPVFKRKTFFNQYEEFLDVSCGQSGYELYQYLAENTEYDLNYIWDTVLRTANMSDIKERMQLNYVLPTQVRLANEKAHARVALFMHIYFTDLVDYCKRYAASMPSYADIYLTTNSEQKKLILEKAFEDFGGCKVKILVIQNRGREISSHFIELKSFVGQYDYICFAHDKKSTHLKPKMKGESFSYHCFENVLASPAFVENIITTFQDNPRLGLLIPPTPIFSTFSSTLGYEWGTNFENVCRLADRLKITVDIEKNKPPLSPLGTIFWYRSEALKILFDAGFRYEDFPEEPIQKLDGTLMHAIERIYPFAAQQAGFYTAWVLSDTFAKMELTNLNKTLWDFNRLLLWKFGPTSRYNHLHMIATSQYRGGKTNIGKKEQIRRILNKIVGKRVYAALRNMWIKAFGNDRI